MSQPDQPNSKPEPCSIEEMKQMVAEAKSQELDPETVEWAKNSVDDPCKLPHLIERAKRMGVPIPED